MLVEKFWDDHHTNHIWDDHHTYRFFSPGIVDDHSIQLRWAKTPQASVIQEEGRQTGAWCG